VPFVGPTGQRFARRTVGPLGRAIMAGAIHVPQGVALGWANRCPFGAHPFSTSGTKTEYGTSLNIRKFSPPHLMVISQRFDWGIRCV
jgi:hypothetical protein